MLKSFAHFSLVVIAAAMAFSVFACSLLGLYLAGGIGIRLPFKEVIAAVCCVVVLGLAIRALPLLYERLDRVTNTPRLWLYAVLVGLTLRLLTWLTSLPEVQVNDGWHYLELAKRLYLGQGYELSGYAFWPPGTPFIYTAAMLMVGDIAGIAVIVNCAFFLLAAISVRAICQFLNFAPRNAGFTVAVLAFWPALFLPISQVSKELLLIGMLPTVLALLLSRRSGAALLAGCIAGLAILTQPSLMFLPLFLCAALIGAHIPLKTIIVRMLFLCAGAVAVIAPWSYRNYQVFGELVPVSTNAGLVFHAGNQPAMVQPLGAVGGYLEPPAPPTPMMNDLLVSRWHTEEAVRFILSNKADFTKLVWNRLVITMGDDSDSAYRSLRLTNKVSDKVYLISKLLSNTYWMIVAALLAASCWSARKSPARLELAPLAILGAGVTLYLMAVHGLAEGGARHHMAWSWIYALVMVAGLGGVKHQAASGARTSSTSKTLKRNVAA
ncbi:MAG: hypothetical protein ACXWVG_15055 [Telluria sp.]